MANLQFLVLFSIISSLLFGIGTAVPTDFNVRDHRGYYYDIIYDGELRSVTTNIKDNIFPVLITRVHKVLPNAFRNITATRLLLSTREKNFQLEPESFNGLLKLQDLTFLGGVVTLKPKLFQSVPSITEMFIKIDGSKQNFSHAFPELPHLKKLTVARSNLSYVNSNTFFKMFPPISHLKLQENNIYMIEKNAFSTLKKLKNLEVILNPPLYLESGCFNGLDNLEILDLTFNGMVSISKNIFNNITKLRRLNLRNNKIQQIEAGSFSGMNNLTELILDNNNLIYLEEGLFDGLPNLEKLSLVNSKIEQMNGTVFFGLNILELSLSNNNIKTLAYDSLYNMPRLENLYLINSNISKIEPGAFSDLKLGILDLRNNHLTEIEYETFLGLIANNVFLNNNHIVNIQNDSFAVCGIGHVYLQNNPVSNEIVVNQNEIWGMSAYGSIYRH